jgi:hypothetical protein
MTATKKAFPRRPKPYEAAIRPRVLGEAEANADAFLMRSAFLTPALDPFNEFERFPTDDIYIIYIF